MPKQGKFFKTRIAFDADEDLMFKLIALSYLLGSKGVYAPVARDLLTEAVDRLIQSLGSPEKGQFKQILEAVRAEGLIKRMERNDKHLEIREPSPDLQTPD